MKTCPMCLEKLPAKAFSKNKNSKDGRNNVCRKCQARKEKAQREGKLHTIPKYCRFCKTYKPRDQFNHPDKPQICDDCYNIAVAQRKLKRKKYLKDNKEEARIRAKLYNKKITQQNLRNTFKEHLVRKYGGKCMRCGTELSEEIPAYCFEFHHPGKKKETIGNLTRKYALKFSKNQDVSQVYDEANNCSLLCILCHRIIHTQQTKESE